MDALGTLAMQGGPWGVIALGLVSILRGWLVPRVSHVREIAQVHERSEDYKAALDAEKAISAELRKQIAILLGPKEPKQ